jgi:hypothetical protein
MDYTDSASPRLLLEPQRSNLITYSEQMDNADWLKINTTVTANVIASPDGYTNADKIIPANGNNIAVIYQTIVPAGTSTASIYAKAGEFGGIVIATGTTGAFFNLTTGQYRTAYNVAPTAYSITSVGNGWYRCSVTLTSAAIDNLYIGANDNVSNDLTVTGNGTSGAYIWGAQLEAGAYATSYIPTLGAAVTRGADACSKTGISSLIGQTEGTIFWEGKVGFNNSEVYVFLQNTLGNSIVDSIFIQRASGVGIVFNIYDSSTQVVNISGGTYTIGQTLKIAAAYKLNDVVLYVNGVQIGTDTGAAIPATTSMQLGTYPALPTTESYMSDNVKQALLFPTRLTNAQLAELTTI